MTSTEPKVSLTKKMKTQKNTKSKTQRQSSRHTLAKKLVRTYTMPSNKYLAQYTEQVAPIVNDFDDRYNAEYNSATCRRPPGTGITLKSQQEFVREYINLHTPFRGLVLWHGLGSGKTLSAISISEQFISNVKHDMDVDEAPKKKYTILFISPAMLVSNFETEVQKYDEFYKEVSIYDADYKEFTSNGKLTTYSESKNRGLFENKVIIIDESQILIKTITNAILSKKQSGIVEAYHRMMREETAKIVCLSGTPIDKSPAELAVLFNLLAGVRLYYEVTNIQEYSPSSDTDFTNSSVIVFSSDKSKATVYRNPMYFWSTGDGGLTYTSTGNAYSVAEYQDRVKQEFPGAKVVARYTDELFDVNGFNARYSLPDLSYKYDVTTDSSEKRESDIRNGNTPRTLAVSNAEEFKEKVAGYMSYFGNIDLIVPKAKILDIARSGETYRIGHDNNGKELFTVHRCTFSDYQQEMIRLFKSNAFKNTFVNELYGFMKRNSEHFIYPFEHVEIFKENFVKNAPVRIVDGLRKFCASEKIQADIASGKYGAMNTVSKPIILRRLLTRMKYVYEMMPQMTNLENDILLEKYVENEHRKRAALIAKMGSENSDILIRAVGGTEGDRTEGAFGGTSSRKISKKRSRNSKKSSDAALIAESIRDVQSSQNRRTKKSITYKYAQGDVYDMADLIQFIESKNGHDSHVIHACYTSYVKILSDVVLCTFPVRSVWTPVPDPLPQFHTSLNCDDTNLHTSPLGSQEEEIKHEVYEGIYDVSKPVEYCQQQLSVATNSGKNLQNCSSKMFEIMLRILQNPDACHIIYSEFKQVNIPLARVLMANGYEQLKIKETGVGSGGKRITIDGEYDRTKPHFMYITGSGGSEDVDEEDSQFYKQLWPKGYDEGQLDSKLKQHYINIFNGDIDDSVYSMIRSKFKTSGADNSRGQLCNVVILNSAAAEGITLKTVRYVHLLHPPASMAKIYQIIGRAIRNCTHEKLPEEERDVTPILYLSRSQTGEMTNDEKKYNECVNVADRYVPYLNMLKETAVDCKLNQQIRNVRDGNREVHPGLKCIVNIP